MYRIGSYRGCVHACGLVYDPIISLRKLEHGSSNCIPNLEGMFSYRSEVPSSTEKKEIFVRILYL